MNKKWNSPKEYLSRVIILAEKIDRDIDSLGEMWSKATRVNKNLKIDLVQESGLGDPTDAIVDIVDLKSKTNKDIKELIELRRNIEREIRGLENPLHVRILSHKYISGKTLCETAEIMNYTYGYIRNQHGWALESFRKKYQDKFKRKQKM